MNEYEVRLISSLEKLLPKDYTLALRPLKRLSGFRGQRIAFQAAYRFNGDYYLDQTLEQGTINPSVLVRVEGPLAEFVRIRRVDCVPVMTPCGNRYDENYLSYEPGMFPDLLSDFNGWIQFIPRQWRTLWIDIELPKEFPGGDSRLTLRFTGTGGNTVAQEELDIHVVPASLPKQTLIHTEWIYPDCLADYYGIEAFSEEHWRITEEFVRLAARRGVNMLLTPVFTPALDTLIGKYRSTAQLAEIEYDGLGYKFRWERLHRWIEMGKRAGMKYFEIGHLFSQWGAKFAPKVVVSQNGETVLRFGWHTPAQSKEYREFLDIFLPKLTEQLELEGIGDKVFFHISDEPTSGNADTYLAAKKMALSWLDKYPILDALSHVDLYKDGTVERPVPMSDVVEEFLDAGVEHRWMYYCCAQSVDVANRFLAMPSYRSRILGIQLYKYDMEGFLHWGFNFYNSQYSICPIDPYRVNDSVDTFPAGDPYIVYPGKDGKPVESMRLPILEDAMNDVRALKMLEGLTGKEKVLSLIEADTAVTLSSYPCHASYLMDLWETIAVEIEQRL